MFKLYAIPIILALLIKVGLMIFAKRKGIKSEYLFGLIIVFVFQNIAELSLFIEYDFGNSGYFFTRAYYVAASVTSIFACYYAFEIERNNQLSTLLHYILLPAFGLLILTVMATDYIIVGSTPISYGITAVKGKAYWCFQIMVLAVVFFVGYILVSGYRRELNQVAQLRCAYGLLAFLPVIVTVLFVLALMAIGYKFNAMAVYPISTTAFIFILVLSERKHRLTDVRQYIPNSLESGLSSKTRDAISLYSQEKLSHKELISALNKADVDYKLRKLKGNVAHTAVSMKEPRSSLYFLINEHGLDLKKYREEK